jgi:hypothetical protein
MRYQITPIRNDFLINVREAGIDDQNQAVMHIIAKGGEPCRDVLRRAKPGEYLILASYCPFIKSGPYKEYGAVFVLKHQSDEAFDIDTLPLPTGSPSDYFGDNFVLRAYDNNEAIVDARIATLLNAELIIDEFLAQKKVSFIMARFTAYGCYALKLERK